MEGWMLQAVALCLLTRGCCSWVRHTDRGCMKWSHSGDDVCCEICHPGNHLVTPCGRSPVTLCTPCEPGTYSLNPNDYKCEPCTQCVGAQVLKKDCTATSDTVCGCIDGLTCGDARCSFCVEKCGKGQEPTKDRSCRPCPDGTFNDQTQQMCKPWKTKCPSPDQYIAAKGDAFTDITCANMTVSPARKPSQPSDTEQTWPIVFFMVTTIALLCTVLLIIVAIKTLQKRKKTTKTIKTTQIIRTPTDDPRTLIAVECSFHEAQQEQGSSSESLDSKDSEDHLIA